MKLNQSEKFFLLVFLVNLLCIVLVVLNTYVFQNLLGIANLGLHREGVDAFALFKPIRGGNIHFLIPAFIPMWAVSFVTILKWLECVWKKEIRKLVSVIIAFEYVGLVVCAGIVGVYLQV